MALIRRVALLSLHTSPMEQPGAGDAGGMNVYIRALAMALAEAGVEVEIFTRSTTAGQPAVEHPEPGVCVHNVMAGPPRKLPKEELPALLHSMVEEIEQIRRRQLHGRYDVIHSHYWVSGRGRAGVVRTVGCAAGPHHAHHGQGQEPRARIRRTARAAAAGGRRTTDRGRCGPADRQHPAEADELVSHYGADYDRIDVAPPGVDLDMFTPAFRTAVTDQRASGRTASTSSSPAGSSGSKARRCSSRRPACCGSGVRTSIWR